MTYVSHLCDAKKSGFAADGDDAKLEAMRRREKVEILTKMEKESCDFRRKTDKKRAIFV